MQHTSTQSHHSPIDNPLLRVSTMLCVAVLSNKFGGRIVAELSECVPTGRRIHRSRHPDTFPLGYLKINGVTHLLPPATAHHQAPKHAVPHQGTGSPPTKYKPYRAHRGQAKRAAPMLPGGEGQLPPGPARGRADVDPETLHSVLVPVRGVRRRLLWSWCCENRLGDHVPLHAGKAGMLDAHLSLSYPPWLCDHFTVGHHVVHRRNAGSCR